MTGASNLPVFILCSIRYSASTKPRFGLCGVIGASVAWPAFVVGLREPAATFSLFPFIGIVRAAVIAVYHAVSIRIHIWHPTTTHSSIRFVRVSWALVMTIIYTIPVTIQIDFIATTHSWGTLQVVEWAPVAAVWLSIAIAVSPTWGGVCYFKVNKEKRPEFFTSQRSLDERDWSAISEEKKPAKMKGWLPTTHKQPKKSTQSVLRNIVSPPPLLIFLVARTVLLHTKTETNSRHK